MARLPRMEKLPSKTARAAIANDRNRELRWPGLSASLREKKGQLKSRFFVLFCFGAPVFFPRGLYVFAFILYVRKHAERISLIADGVALSEVLVDQTQKNEREAGGGKRLDQPFIVHLFRYKIVAHDEGDKTLQGFDKRTMAFTK